MVYAYYGDGQGKTSALNGLCLRAVASGRPVLYARFFKGETFGGGNRSSTEDAALARLGVRVIALQDTEHFVWTNNAAERQKVIDAAKRTLEFVKAAYPRHDFVFLDEGLDLVANKIVSAPELAALLRRMDAGGRHVFVSGHAMNADVASACALITRCVKEKHPFDAGQKAVPHVDF